VSPTHPTAGSPIRLAFSPDSDDIFMFWALLSGKIETQGLSFVAERADTETLNARAAKADVDVLAISIARYATVSRDYLLLPHGASIGRGYGPVVVARTPMTLGELEGKRIGVPGLQTTAYLTLRILFPHFEAVTVPISPYARTFEALRSGEVEAALVIHEGRLTFEKEGMLKVTDIGEDWGKLTGLPLPLGGNAIRRGLGEARIAQISRLCRESISWALAHREEVMTALIAEESRPALAIDRALLDRYLAMYANEDTLDMKADVKEAIVELFRRGAAAGVIPSGATPEFSP
jgi:1,4-dihydroxy-6-naphthoate synthase